MSRRHDIILDVDGVCADFVGHVVHTLGLDPIDFDFDQWDIFKTLEAKDPKLVDRAFAMLRHGDWWTGQPSLAGALEAVQELREHGHRIIWATSPWLSCAEWSSVRRDWLLSRGFAALCFGDRFVFTDSKYLIRGDFLLDDNADTVRTWQAHQRQDETMGYSMLFDAPYNRHEKLNHGSTRGRWPEFLELVLGA